MNNNDTGFDEYNYERKRNKIKLYNSILNAMRVPVTIEQIVNIHGQSRKPSFYSNIITNMIKTGHIAKCGKAEGNKIIYHVIKPVYTEALGEKPKSRNEKKPDEIIAGSRVFKLEDYQERYAATQKLRTPAKQNVWIGCQMGTMSY